MKKFKAFTLPELLIIFVIIGIIATVGMATIKPWEKAYKYAYTRIYNALSIAIYNHMINTGGDNSFPQDSTDFCKALLEYINTSDNAESSSSNSCNLTSGSDEFLTDAPSLSDFLKGGKNPKIKASNGAKLWIGSSNNKAFSFEQTIKDTSDVVKYYIVYADINGDRGPNIIAYDGKRLPDIVAFAVTDKFAVIPLGYPKVDQRYLSAHIMYPVSEDDDEASAEGERPSPSMTYYEAIVGAYGKGENKITTYGVIQTYDLEESLPDNSSFKLVGSDLDSKYATPPEFDSAICGEGLNTDELIQKNLDSHCDVKIYEYN